MVLELLASVYTKASTVLTKPSFLKMSELELKQERPGCDTLNSHTPPQSQNSKTVNTNDHTKNIKFEKSNKKEDLESDADQENEAPKSNIAATEKKKTNNIKIEQTSTPIEGNKTTRKRGRPKMTNEEREDKAKKLKTEVKPQLTLLVKKESTEKPSTIKKEGTDASEKKAARSKKGISGFQFTPAHDGFLRDIFTNSKNEKLSLAERYERFEAIFQTGISQNSFRFRWYKLRDIGTFLTGEEETKLKDAIKTTKATEKDISKVLKEYSKGGEDTTKISHAYVLKKMKEWKIEDEGEDQEGSEEDENEGSKEEEED
ncbi:hypothetical protein TWF694_009302 [Orbilia ellipsospora]|uniref:Uncharacterized protein n=1 Tax=Orbilia ellipsospora TaxID=2528407 RepID=A0AAV9XEZ1_9PEZI